MASKAKRPRGRPGTRLATGRNLPPHIRPSVPVDQVANRVAVAGAPGLARLMRLPRPLLPLVAATMLLVGLTLGGIAGLVLLLTLSALLGWLLMAFWPVTPTPGRALRLAVVLAIALLGVLKAGA